MLTTNAQINHADISNYVTGVNRLFSNPNIAHLWSPYTAAGRAALNAMVTDQAQIIAYIDDYEMMIFTTLPALLLLFLMRRARPTPRPAEQHAAVE